MRELVSIHVLLHQSAVGSAAVSNDQLREKICRHISSTVDNFKRPPHCCEVVRKTNEKQMPKPISAGLFGHGRERPSKEDGFYEKPEMSGRGDCSGSSWLSRKKCRPLELYDRYVMIILISCTERRSFPGRDSLKCESSGNRWHMWPFFLSISEHKNLRFVQLPCCSGDQIASNDSNIRTPVVRERPVSAQHAKRDTSDERETSEL